MKRAGKHDEGSLRMSMKVLALNPEFYTAWNFRRQILSSFIKTSPETVKKVHRAYAPPLTLSVFRNRTRESQASFSAFRLSKQT